MKKSLLCFVMFCMATILAQATLSQHDLNAPFGWATCTSLTSGNDYSVTGGGNGKSITLTSSGKDMHNEIIEAINTYDIIVFDGTKGDFIISSSITLENIKNKTIVGINNARLCTQFYVTAEIKAALDQRGVKSMSTSSGGGTLPNGEKVKEAREYYTRLTIAELLNDPDENFRNAGIFYVKGCENIIFRNIKFVGPGPVDVGGLDLVSFIYGTTHCWVDHCDFTDGIDGNFDITQYSDFITVSWCTFSYTDRAYDHMNTNLIGGSTSEPSDNKLNVTWANCMWGKGCDQRMPMARFGTIHIYNCYYNCGGNKASVNPREKSKYLIEGNYFAEDVQNVFSQSGATAYVWKDDNIVLNSKGQSQIPSSHGSVSVPYQYTTFNANDVPSVVGNGAGATLDNPLTIGISTSTDTKDATLESLSINGISVLLQNGIFDYAVELPSTATSINVTATPSNSNATVQTTVPTIAELPANAVIKVTSADGSTTETYKVAITRLLSNDTSLSSLTVNGNPAIKTGTNTYAYKLPLDVAEINIVAVPNATEATIENMVIPNVSALPSNATFTVVAEDGTRTEYSVMLSITNNDYSAGKTWDFTTWSSETRSSLSNNPEIWKDLGDGRYEATFAGATDLGFVETENITFLNGTRINPSTSGSGYIQGNLVMNVPVVGKQEVTIKFSNTNSTTRSLVIDGVAIKEVTGTHAITATYTVPEGKTSIAISGTDNGLRYYGITLSAIEPDPTKTYTVTYKVDDAVYETMTEQTTVVYPSTNPVKEGYTFTGWDVAAGTTLSGNITINAQFTPNSSQQTDVLTVKPNQIGTSGAKYEVEYISDLCESKTASKQNWATVNVRSIESTASDYTIGDGITGHSAFVKIRSDNSVTLTVTNCTGFMIHATGNAVTATVTENGTTVGTGTFKDAQSTYEGTLEANRTYTITINGEKSSSNSNLYAIALKAPDMPSYILVPRHNSTKVDIKTTSRMSIDFGQEIASVDMTKISISPISQSATLREVGNNIGSTTLVFQPTTWNTYLEYNTRYTITVEAGAVTFVSNLREPATNEAFTWSFTTDDVSSGIVSVQSKGTLNRKGNILTTESEHPIEIYNLQGVCVIKGNVTIDLSRLSRGIYIAKCGKETLRIVK